MKRTLLLFIFCCSLFETIGQAVQTHPRLWLRQQDLPALKAKANSNNPYFVALRSRAQSAKADMDQGHVPNEDQGGTAYDLYPSEMYAMLFGFMSLITDGTESQDYATRARTCLMYGITKAAQGVANNQPFRDDGFSVFDRSRWWFHGFPLTVDWIYPHLSASDKTTIRQVFLRWCDENTHANTTTDNHPEPIGVRLDTRLFNNHESDAESRRSVRYSSNNYYLAHVRNIYLMAASMDNTDDPGGTLHKYIDDVTGAWLYVTEEYMKNEGRGGLSAEGFLYGPSAFGRLAQTLLAIYTSGEANAISPIRGTRSTFDTPLWNEIVPAFYHSVSPKAYTDHEWPWMGKLYYPFNFGDIQHFRVDDAIELFGPLGWYDKMTGNNANRLNQVLWLQTHIAPGGQEELISRIRSSADFQESVLYFLLLDPVNAPTDPRNSFSKTWYAAGIGRILSRTDWTADATAFTFKCGFNRIDHQFGDGNSFSFYRKGAFLTSELSGYGFDMAVSRNRNTMALQNNNPGGDAGSPLGVAYQSGSQWFLSSKEDGKILSWFDGSTYMHVTGDATGLYKYVNPWVSPTGDDITHASRTVVWLKPDYLIIYDRATSKTAGRYKQFWLGLPSAANILGKTATVNAPNGQTLHITNLLPANAVLSAQPYGQYDEPAENDPMSARLMVQDPSHPRDIRFLHVLQGRDNGQSTLLTSSITSSGDTYQGALVGNVIVMFKKDLQQPFQTLSFNAPQTAESSIITGLDPATSYKVDKVAQLDGSWLVTISLGTGSLSDAGGAITIGELAAENPNSITGTEISIGEESVTVWPNPVQDRVSIKSSYPIKEIRMLDLRGNVLRKNQINNLMETSLYVGDVNRGIYLIQLRTNKGLVTKKIIKQ